MTEIKEKLFSEFHPVTAQEWKDKITADLKGVPFEKKVVWKSEEGFSVLPFYTSEDIEGMATTTSLPGEFPYIRGTKTGSSWLIRQDIYVTDYKAANEKAKRLTAECGVTSLGFHLKSDSVSAENLAILLDGVCPEKIELNFSTCIRKIHELIGIITGLYKTLGVDMSKCKGSFAYNPLKKPLVKGIALNDAWVKEVVAAVEACEALPGYRTLAVEACMLNDAGSYITQELGYALAWGNDLIAKLSEAGQPVEKVANHIKFNFGISSNYFMEIAKFRAARMLWAEIVRGYHPACMNACKMNVHARTSTWNMTRYDAYVNMLRTQTETMAAAIAGVDSITVLPYDAAFQAPDEFSERIARNQQLILKEECHFDQVTDPAAGSYYIEVLTQSIADAARKLFLETEEKGGFITMANKGEVQQSVNDSGLRRRNMLANRSLILLGTNQYPNFTEKAADKIKTSDDGGGCGCRTNPESMVTKLDFSRGASDFEALRLATEHSGKTPKVFLLTIGSPAMRLARAQFSANFFACAGYEIIDNPGFETVAEGVKAAHEQKADIIVLCSSDDEYPTYAPEAFQLIAGKALFIIAGAPPCKATLESIGITHFIHLKSNILETLCNSVPPVPLC